MSDKSFQSGFVRISIQPLRLERHTENLIEDRAMFDLF